MGRSVIVGLLSCSLAGLCLGQPSGPSPERSLVALPGAATASGTIALSAPAVLSMPGYYRVVRNVTGDGIVFDVQSSQVTLDLGGFLVGSTSVVLPTIRVLPPQSGNQLEDVTIENGTIRGGNPCMFIDRTARVAARRLNLGGCDGGLKIEDATNGAIVEQIQIGRWGNESIGIDIGDCWNCRIRENVVHGGTTLGLGVQYAIGGEISGNQVLYAGVGFQIGGDGVVLRDNVATGCGSAVELQTDNSLIEGFAISGGGSGLRFMVQAADNIYKNNSTRGVNNESFVDEGSGNLSAGGNHLPDPR